MLEISEKQVKRNDGQLISATNQLELEEVFRNMDLSDTRDYDGIIQLVKNFPTKMQIVLDEWYYCSILDKYFYCPIYWSISMIEFKEDVKLWQ